MELKSLLAGALVKFQGEVPVIPKNGTAKITMKSGGSYSYKYAELSDIWEAIRKPLLNNELAVTQFVRSSDTTDYIITKIWHSSGEAESEPFAIPTGGKTPQEVGSVVTYYKRYALGAALGISTEEDDDAQSGNTKPSKKPVQNTFVPSKDKSVTDQQKVFIGNLLRQKGVEGKEAIQEYLADNYGILPESFMSQADAQMVIDDFKENK